ncbi:MAG: DUF1295 domain-containing protein [Bacteroidales bacterium]|nr:DUF1295 domain-containing protein [Bacteroidales bacterium]
MVYLCALDVTRIQPPGLIQYTGIFLTISGVLIFLIALFKIKSLESYEGDLITSGIYSILRHPMYLAFVFWLIGAPLYYGSILSLILSFVFILNVLFWRNLEEKELGARFPSYAEYRNTTIF